MDRELTEFKYSNTQKIDEEYKFTYEILPNKKKIYEDIERILNNDIKRYDSLLISKTTPYKLISLGLENLPIFMSQNHVRNCLTPKGNNTKWHGLEKNTLINLTDDLSSPTIVMKNLTDSNSIVHEL